MFLLAILIILTLTICNSYNLRGSNTYQNSLINKNNTYENLFPINKNNTDVNLFPINNITEINPMINCHPDILPENCNTAALYPYPINTKYYRICFYDTIEIYGMHNPYNYVKYNNKLNLLLFTYLHYFDGVSAKADIQGWCPRLI